MKTIIFATGVEGSDPTVQGGKRRDQLQETRHYGQWRRVSRGGAKTPLRAIAVGNLSAPPEAVHDAQASQARFPMHQPSESASKVEVQQLLRSAVVGTLAGLSASWIMNRIQAAVTAVTKDDGGSDDSSEEMPTTVKAADMLSETATGEPVPEPYEQPAGSAVHYGFGAFLGGLYGVLGEFLPGVRAGFGTAYGAGVAIVADEAIVPAAGLTPPPQNVPVSAHAYGLASHLVFGAALEGTRRLIDEALSASQSEPVAGAADRAGRSRPAGANLEPMVADVSLNRRHER